MNEGYTRDPMDCEQCRVEHGIAKHHIGSDPKANCGKCMSQNILKGLIKEVDYD